MIKYIQNLVKFCPSILKIWSKNQFLKGRNSVEHLPKKKLYNINIDLVDDLHEFCPSDLKILSKNQFLTSFKGCNSVANLRKMTLYCSNIDLVNDNVYTNFC